MPLVPDQDLVLFASSLADDARRISNQFFRQPHTVSSKSDGTPVTIADLEIEQHLRKVIGQHYPDHGVYGEEEGLSGSATHWLWVLDPIDGTKSFTTGKPTFGCLIALLYQCKPVLGIIDMPALDERWVGIQDQTTLYNGSPCKAAETHVLADATLNATTVDMFDPQEWQIFCQVNEAVRFRQFGADCYAYGLLALGYTDLVMEAGLGRFDYLALVPVIKGAGGCISDWEGEALTFDSTGQVLASANPTLHAQALRLIASAP